MNVKPSSPLLPPVAEEGDLTTVAFLSVVGEGDLTAVAFLSVVGEGDLTAVAFLSVVGEGDLTTVALSVAEEGELTTVASLSVAEEGDLTTVASLSVAEEGVLITVASLSVAGEKILNKKAVYEPSTSQRCRQLVCSRRWAVAILVTMGLFLLLIAVIAAFARPGSILCQNLAHGQNHSQAAGGGPAAKTEKTYVSTDGRPFPWKDIRLPRSVLPDAYEIFLHPNLTRSVFSGKVTVRCSVVDSTDFLVFHVKDLNVTGVALLRGEVAVEVADRMEYKANEQFYVRLRQPLAAGSKVTLVVDFSAALVKKLAGFYKSSYQTAAGETRLGAVVCVLGGGGGVGGWRGCTSVCVRVG